ILQGHARAYVTVGRRVETRQFTLPLRTPREAVKSLFAGVRHDCPGANQVQVVALTLELPTGETLQDLEDPSRYLSAFPYLATVWPIF
ncbi:MAG TPA: hypothetical protein VGE59_04380, partial [Patescibacteria group bacterium]